MDSLLTPLLTSGLSDVAQLQLFNQIMAFLEVRNTKYLTYNCPSTNDIELEACLINNGFFTLFNFADRKSDELDIRILDGYSLIIGRYENLINSETTCAQLIHGIRVDCSEFLDQFKLLKASNIPIRYNFNFNEDRVKSFAKIIIGTLVQYKDLQTYDNIFVKESDYDCHKKLDEQAYLMAVTNFICYLMKEVRPKLWID